MAVSRDGYTFMAVNEGDPVLAGDTIAQQRGIRNPHISCRPEYGWGNNRGLVLMKSWDVIHWNRANIRFGKLSVGLGEIGCIWALEVACDDKKGKLMIYYIMRFKSEPINCTMCM